MKVERTVVLWGVIAVLLFSGCSAIGLLGEGLFLRGMGAARGLGGIRALGASRALAAAGSTELAIGVRAIAAESGVLRIASSGRIAFQGRHLATLTRQGEILSTATGSRPIGLVRNGQLIPLTKAGRPNAPIGRITGVTPGSGVRLYDGPGFGSKPVIRITKPEVAFDVLQVQNDWYEIRLANQQTGWLWAPYAALSLLLLNDEATWNPEKSSVVNVVLKNGEALWGKVSDVTPETIRLIDEDERPLLIDRSIIFRIDRIHGDRTEWDWTAGMSKVHLTNGTKLLGERYEVRDDALVLHLPGESSEIVIDDALWDSVSVSNIPTDEDLAMEPEPDPPTRSRPILHTDPDADARHRRGEGPIVLDMRQFQVVPQVRTHPPRYAQQQRIVGNPQPCYCPPPPPAYVVHHYYPTQPRHFHGSSRRMGGARYRNQQIRSRR